ncbi:aldo/keto reductase, partial [bacterium]
MELNHLRPLGRSGLLVSPFALGTMTMGNSAWGSPDDVSREIFDAYTEAGGNFIDTADVYSSGRSEELIGRFVAERGLRDRLVLATKYAFNFDTSGDVNATPNPLAGGSSRKNLNRAIDGSLKRLGTDYIDLYWMHVWDGITPVAEVVGALSDLVRAGKILYYGFSDTPAWFSARAATLAAAHGDPAPIAMQEFYSLVSR